MKSYGACARGQFYREVPIQGATRDVNGCTAQYLYVIGSSGVIRFARVCRGVVAHRAVGPERGPTELARRRRTPARTTPPPHACDCESRVFTRVACMIEPCGVLLGRRLQTDRSCLDGRLMPRCRYYCAGMNCVFLSLWRRRARAHEMKGAAQQPCNQRRSQHFQALGCKIILWRSYPRTSSALRYVAT